MSRLDGVGIGKQTALGTKNTTPDYWLAVESAEPSPNTEYFMKEETIGHRFPTDEELGTSFFEVSLAGAARALSFPRVLGGFFGLPTTTTPGGGTNSRKHAFSPTPSTVLSPTSLFVHRADPSPKISDLYWDALGNTLSMSVAPNDFLLYEAAYAAKEIDDTVSIAPTITTDLTRRWTFDECKVFLSVDGGGETEVKVAEWGVEYSNNLATDLFVLGSKRLYRIDQGNINCTCSFTPVEALSTHYRRTLADPRNNVKVRLLAEGSTIESTIKYTVEFIVYRARYREGTPVVNAGDTLRTLPVTLAASYDSALSKMVDVNVINLGPVTY